MLLRFLLLFEAMVLLLCFVVATEIELIMMAWRAPSTGAPAGRSLKKTCDKPVSENGNENS